MHVNPTSVIIESMRNTRARARLEALRFRYILTISRAYNDDRRTNLRIRNTSFETGSWINNIQEQCSERVHFEREKNALLTDAKARIDIFVSSD